MKNIIYSLCYFTLFVFIFIYLINYSDILSIRVIDVSLYFIKNLLPVLFISFILTNFFINSNLPFYLYKYFKINYIFLFSILFGSPTNALLINNYDNKCRYLIVTKYTSLIYSFIMISKIVNDKYLTIMLIVLNICINLIMWELFNSKRIEFNYQLHKFDLVNAIKISINNIIGIYGTILFFYLLPIYLINNEYVKMLLYSILEVSTSYQYLLTTHINQYFKLLCLFITISSSGLCIDEQIKSIISDTSLDYKMYYKYRFIHLVIYILLAFIIVFLYQNRI